MKKVFLTGGAGFIGSHLADFLLSQGIEVTVYDNLATGRRQDVPKGCEFVEGDLLAPETLRKFLPGHDVVWHLAANTIMQGATTDFDLLNNVVGTYNVLEAMRSCNVKQLLFSSTAAAYGDEGAKKLSETHGPMKPISLYAATKLGAEALVSAYSHLFGIEAWIFRFANVVGGGMGHGVIYDFVQKLKKDPKHLEIWGDGKGLKPYFLVEDCIRGMMTAYRSRPAGSYPSCDIYNLGCDTYTSVDAVAAIVMNEMDLKSVEVTYTGGRRGFPGDVPIVNYDATKMNLIGWWVRTSSDKAVRAAAYRIIRGLR
jgi:UDP-glucose 4-epimerase